MSEIEQVSEPDKQIPTGTNDIDSVETPQQPQEHLLVSDDVQPLTNGTVASPSSAQSTPAAVPPQIKRFSSANISKKFLQKTTATLNSSNALSTANNSSSGPAPSKAAVTTGQPPHMYIYHAEAYIYNLSHLLKWRFSLYYDQRQANQALI